MNKLLFFLLFLVGLFLLELAFFALARRWKIIDKPNERSMHSKPVYRGGGVVFPLAFIAYGFFVQPMPLWAMGSLFLVSFFSFLDDLRDLPSLLRFAVQALVVLLLLFELQLFSLWGVWAVLALVILVGTLNAYNFMDGINGITVAYSAVFFVSISWLNEHLAWGLSHYFLLAMAASLLVFGFFNFRKKARCFAGDVGSVGMALIVLYSLLQMVAITKNPIWIFLLSVYGIDTIFTIVQRLRMRQNIFEAHKLHLFQMLVYRVGLSHLQVSGLYAFAQLVYNLGLVLIYLNFQGASQWLFLGLLTLVYAAAYWAVKLPLWRKESQNQKQVA